MFESAVKPYIHFKNELTKEQQEELEDKMNIYFDCTLELYTHTGELISSSTSALTRKQIGNIVGIHTKLIIRDSYPIGFNYDINGNRI